MSMLSDLLSKAQQLELELGKLAMGELGEVKSIALELRQNLELAIRNEVQAPEPPQSTGEGVQMSGDI